MPPVSHDAGIRSAGQRRLVVYLAAIAVPSVVLWELSWNPDFSRAAVPWSTPSGAYIVLGSREWLLSEGSNLVGRDPDCAIRVDSPTVSRHHLRIVVTRERATVEDLGSRNGTRVNGQRLEQRLALREGDEIRIGSVALRYRVLDRLASTVGQTGATEGKKPRP